MMMSKRFLMTGAGLMAAAGLAQAQPMIDGVGLTSEYDQMLWVNGSNPTSFGDNLDDRIGAANGSEIDGIYVTIQNDIFGEPTLYIAISGNLESNFNKVDIFFDTVPGVGQNPLRGDNPDVDFDGLNRMGDDGSGNGLRFDSAFTANYWMGVTTGNFDEGTELAEVYANYCDLDNQIGYWLGMTYNGFGGLSGGENPFGVEATVDNSNILGVTDVDADGDMAGAVDTGWEIAIPLYAIGDPQYDFLMVIFVNGNGHDFLSSQISGGHPYWADHLGEPRDLDLSSIEGDQFVTVDLGNPRGDTFTLNVFNLVGGDTAVFEMTNGTPNTRHYLAYSLRGFGSQPVPQLGITLDLDRPELGGTAQSDGAGASSMSIRIPNAASGRQIWLQGCEQGDKTNVVNQTVQ